MWRLAGEPNVNKWIKGIPYFDAYQCPFCGFDPDAYDERELEELGGKYVCEKYHSTFDGVYSGHSWTDVFKCPICKTIFEF